MTDRDVMDRAARLLGSNVLKGRNPEVEARLGYKPAFQTRVSARNAVDALCLALFPHMGERRQSAIANLLEINQQHREGFGKERECGKCSQITA
jgi:hypothetical protein